MGETIKEKNERRAKEEKNRKKREEDALIGLGKIFSERKENQEVIKNENKD